MRHDTAGLRPGQTSAVSRTDLARLARAARLAARKAYAPFSGFKVGAAVLTSWGRLYTGCNVENSSYGLTVCAERVAILKAVSAGDRSIRAVAVHADSDRRVPPCGACLQVINEFGDNPVILLSNNRTIEARRLRDLLPRGFRFGKKPG